MIVGSHLESRLFGAKERSLMAEYARCAGANGEGGELAARLVGANFPALPTTLRKYEKVHKIRQVHVDLSLEIDPVNEQFTGEAILVLQAHCANACEISLDAKELDVLQVEWSPLVGEWQGVLPARDQWSQVPHSYHDMSLNLVLPKNLSKLEFVCLKVRYSVLKPNAGVYFVKTNPHDKFSYNCVWTQGQDVDSPFWFPCQDDPKLKISSRLTFQFPKDWECVSNGTLLIESIDGPSKIQTWELKAPQAPYLLAFAMGELKKVSTTWRNKEISCYFPLKFLYLQETCLNEMQEMLEFYSNYWGFEYPYEKYAQAFVGQFVFGGMENTTVTINTDECLGPKEFSDGSDFREVLVMHEMAHQWFGDTVTCDSWSEGWLNEGFATHSESLWYEHKHGKEYGPFYVDAYFRASYLSEAAVYQRPIVCNHYEYVSEIFDAHLYQKGALVLNYLRECVGEDAFRASVGAYLEAHKFGSVKTAHLVQALEECAAFPAQQFVDTWIYSAGHADLEVEYVLGGENKLVLEVKVAQKQRILGKACPIGFSLKLLLCFEDGTYKEVTLELSKETESLFLPLERKLSFAVLDPRGTIVGTVAHKIPEAFCEAILSGKHPGASAWVKYLASVSVVKEHYTHKLGDSVFQWLQQEPCLLARAATYQTLADSADGVVGLKLWACDEKQNLCRADWVAALGKIALPEDENIATQEEKLVDFLLALAKSETELLLCRIAALNALLELCKTKPRLRFGELKQKILHSAATLAEGSSYLGGVEGAALSLLAELSANEHWNLFAQRLLDFRKFGSREVLAAATALATVSARHPELRHETRPLLGRMASMKEPIKVLWRVPAIFPLAADVSLVSSMDSFLQRKNYGPLSILIPRARRSREKLLQKASHLDVFEQWAKWEEVKKKVEKIEVQLEKSQFEKSQFEKSQFDKVQLEKKEASAERS